MPASHVVLIVLGGIGAGIFNGVAGGGSLISFPILLDKKWTDAAGIVYFVMFAAGVLAGAVLTAGGGKGRGKSTSKGEK